MKIRAVIASIAVLAAVTAATASDNPITTRQQIMKSVGTATGTASKMLKGEQPYDAAKAELAVRTIYTAAAGIRFYFPEGSETGDNTGALPEIWKSKKDFDARLAKMEVDALAAVGSTADAKTFADAFQNVTQSCGGCHEKFRLKR